MVDTYTITSVEGNEQYELRLATYSSRGISPMSNSIEITTPRQSRVNLDEIIENITRLQKPPRVIENLVPPPMPKGSDLLYLTIGVVAGILLILVLILIVMCVLRFIQRKKLISRFSRQIFARDVRSSLDHMQSVNGSDYAATPCLQHAVVSVDGKLIPFAYPTNVKAPKSLCHGRPENGTIRLNANPLHRLLDDDHQENFYHTLTPFTCHSPYESRNPSGQQS